MIERLFDDIELTVVFGGMIIFLLYGFWFIGYKIYAFFYPEEQDVFLLVDDEKETSSEGEGQPYQNTNQEALPTRLLLANSRLSIWKSSLTG